MRKNSTSSFALFSAAVLLASMAFFSSCKKDADIIMNQPVSGSSNITGCSIQPDTMDLLAMGSLKVGTVIITNDDNNLYVNYTITNSNWKIDSTYLFAGNCDLLPKDMWGNPVIESFQYRGGNTSLSYTIPYSNLDTCICVAAYASVKMYDNGNYVGERIAWARGELINPSGENLYMFHPYCKKFCDGSGDTTTGPDTTGTGGTGGTTGTGTGGTTTKPDTTGTGGTGGTTGTGTGTANQDSLCMHAGQFRTQTQGGWGSKPSGNNPGRYLHDNFSEAFPNGLTVGCDYTIKLTSAQAVTDFLPQGGKARALTSNVVNAPVGNVLAGQVVALTISVTFDQYYASFSNSSVSLGSLIVGSGKFAGMTINQVLAEANKVLGGCSSIYTASEINEVVSSLNENFVDGKINKNFVKCP